MILDNGDVILINHRRMFESDTNRTFVGVVDGYEGGVVKVTGYTWCRNHFGGAYQKKEEKRTKIFSISSGLYIIYQLPDALDVEKLYINQTKRGESILTDGQEFSMDLSESVTAPDGHKA